ncbi:MAG: hypothetical protein M0027_05500 [Candidatus Dormibacteraeota bacterium]|jgi:hypothetical protein|nr:hypothetical protein [Candidatus Dormibacteraeota bacterium]
MSDQVVFIEELHLPDSGDFACVTSVHRAPVDEHACYALNAVLDLIVPGQQFRLRFDGPTALDVLYRALQALIDDRDTGELPMAVGCGILRVRVFTADDDQEAAP